MPPHPLIEVSNSIDPRLLAALGAGLDAHARSVGADATPRDFSCTVRDASAQLIGGLTGNTIGPYAYIARLWVAQAHRRQGLGRRLVASAEALAAQRGCRCVFLSTFAFQAPDFYARCGYDVLAPIDSPDDPKLSRQFMIKFLE